MSRVFSTYLLDVSPSSRRESAGLPSQVAPVSRPTRRPPASDAQCPPSPARPISSPPASPGSTTSSWAGSSARASTSSRATPGRARRPSPSSTSSAGSQAGEPCLYITLTESRRRPGERLPRRTAGRSTGVEICDLTEVGGQPGRRARGVRLPPVRDRAGGDDPGDLRRGRAGQAPARRLRRPVRDAAPVRQTRSATAASSSPSRSSSSRAAGHRPAPRRPVVRVRRRPAREPGRREHRPGAVSSRSTGGPAAGCTSPRSAGRTSARGTTTTRSSDGGVVVHPRLVAAEHHERFDRDDSARAASPNLDAMLGGGLTTGIHDAAARPGRGRQVDRRHAVRRRPP